MLYQCSDVTPVAGDPELLDAVEADDPEEAAEKYARDREHGYHESQEMLVRVLDPGSGSTKTFKVEVEWDPCYHATEVFQPKGTDEQAPAP